MKKDTNIGKDTIVFYIFSNEKKKNENQHGEREIVILLWGKSYGTGQRNERARARGALRIDSSSTRLRRPNARKIGGILFDVWHYKNSRLSVSS